MPLEKSTPSLSPLSQYITQLSLSREAGSDCRLVPFDCAKQRGGHRRDVMEKSSETSTGAPCMTPLKKPAFVFDDRMILDGDALRKIGFKVTTIGRQIDLRQKYASVVGDSVVLPRRPRGLLVHFVETVHIIQLRPISSPSCVILIYALCATNKNIRDKTRAIQGSCAHPGLRHPSKLDKLLHVRQWQANHRQAVQQVTKKLLCASLRRRHSGHHDRHCDESNLGGKNTPAHCL